MLKSRCGNRSSSGLSSEGQCIQAVLLSEVVRSPVQFSCSVVSDSLWPHGLQHARLPCPSPTPRVYSNSCPSNRWCHPTILSSIIPFSSCPQSFPPSRSFQMSQLFASGGQSIGVSASASALPMNIQDWFSLGFPLAQSMVEYFHCFLFLKHCELSKHKTDSVHSVSYNMVNSIPWKSI